jgi:hypothetical protein
MTLRIVPVDFRQARAFIQAWHRHHRPPVGHSAGHPSLFDFAGVAS